MQIKVVVISEELDMRYEALTLASKPKNSKPFGNMTSNQWATQAQTTYTTMAGTNAMFPMRWKTWDYSPKLLEFFARLTMHSREIDRIISPTIAEDNDTLKTICFTAKNLIYLTNVLEVTSTLKLRNKWKSPKNIRNKFDVFSEIQDLACQGIITRFVDILCEKSPKAWHGEEGDTILTSLFVKKIFGPEEAARKLDLIIHLKYKQTRILNNEGHFENYLKEKLGEDIAGEFDYIFAKNPTKEQYEKRATINTQTSMIIAEIADDITNAIIKYPFLSEAKNFITLVFQTEAGKNLLQDLKIEQMSPDMIKSSDLHEMLTSSTSKTKKFGKTMLAIKNRLKNCGTPQDANEAVKELIHTYGKDNVCVNHNDNFIRISVSERNKYQKTFTQIEDELSKALNSTVKFDKKTLKFDYKGQELIVDIEPIFDQSMKRETSESCFHLKNKLEEGPINDLKELLNICQQSNRSVNNNLKPYLKNMIAKNMEHTKISINSPNNFKALRNKLARTSELCTVKDSENNMCYNRSNVPGSTICSMHYQLHRYGEKTGQKLLSKYHFHWGLHAFTLYTEKRDVNNRIRQTNSKRLATEHFERIFNQEEKLLYTLWDLTEKLWPKLQNTESRDEAILELEREMKQNGYNPQSRDTWISKVQIINMKVQLRYYAHYQAKKLAPKNILRDYIKTLKSVISDQGQGAFVTKNSWPNTIKRDANKPDTAENYLDKNEFAMRIVPTDGETKAPQVTMVGNCPSPFIAPLPANKKYLYTLSFNWAWFMISPDTPVREKKLQYEVRENKHIHRFTHTSVHNVSFGQGKKDAKLLGITDISVHNQPKAMTKQQLFQTLAWKKLKQNIGFADEGQSYIDRFLNMAKSNMTRRDCFDYYAQALSDMYDKRLDPTSANFYCNIERQTYHAMINELGDVGICTNFLMGSMASHSAVIKASDNDRQRTPEFHQKFNSTQMYEYKSNYEELKNAKRVELGTMLRHTYTIFTPAMEMKPRNVITNQILEATDPTASKLFRDMHVNTVHVSCFGKNICGNSHVWGGLLPADMMGSPTTLNQIVIRGNPKIKPNNNIPTRQIIQGKDGTIADYRENYYDFEKLCCNITNQLNAEGVNENNEYTEISVNNITIERGQIKPDNKVIKMETASTMLFQHNGKIQPYGGSTIEMMAQAAGQMSAHITADSDINTQSSGILPSTSFGVIIFDDAGSQTSYKREENKIAAYYKYPNHFVADWYSEKGTLKKAQQRLDFRRLHSDTLLFNNRDQYTVSRQLSLNNLTKGLANNEDQQNTELRDGRGNLRFKQNSQLHVATQQQASYQKHRQHDQKQLMITTENNRKTLESERHATIQKLEKVAKIYKTTVPVDIDSNRGFIRSLQQVRNYTDFTDLWVRQYTTAYLLTPSQLQILAKKHKFKNAALLIQCSTTLWNNSNADDFVGKELQGVTTESEEDITLRALTEYIDLLKTMKKIRI